MFQVQCTDMKQFLTTETGTNVLDHAFVSPEVQNKLMHIEKNLTYQPKGRGDHIL